MSKQTKLSQQYEIDTLTRSPQIGALTVKLLQIQKQTGLKALAVLSSTQHDGKTSVTSSLAISYASTGRRVLLINANPFDETSKLVSRTKGGLSDLLTATKLDIGAFAAETQYEGLSILSGNQGALHFSNVSTQVGFKSILQSASDQYDLILFDGPATADGAEGLALADLVKSVLIVLRRDHSKIKEVDSMMKDLGGTDARVVGSVVLDN